MGLVFVYSFCLALFLLMTILIKNRQNKQRAKLPPGSMGWPYIGETLQLYSQNPNFFFTNKQKRYGEIFKTHILGCPCVMVASPEAIKFVLVTQANLFKPTYPSSKEKLIGPSAIFFHQGNYHTQIRKLVQVSLSLDVIRNLVPHIEAIAISALESFSNGNVVNTFHEMKKFAFDAAVLTIFGNLESSYREKLKINYHILDKGYNSLPTNLPGTLYSKSLMARKRLSRIIGEMMRERKEKNLVQNDLLGYLLKFKDENGLFLSDDKITDNIIGVLFAAQDTTASLLTWILKYIHDDPKLLEAIKKEQTDIYESNGRGKRALTWSQTRNMPITNRVIMESLRMASVISFTFREAIEDVEYKGYLIPKGWKVLPLFRNIHHNPDFFIDPHLFNPSRFEVGPKANSFMPFGNGVHACPGNEVARLEIIILIHHLITKFRWEIVGCVSGVEYDPFPIPEQGLPATFCKQSTNHSCP
ncbi:abscisic acid 8'-hydroxylase 4-like [Mercurialis annua]|uniref:abscisic acid 8'-hydroxylase 4-like n=1 Tax=Mercurialis annua TaxID=3986 RepID=UPI00215E9C70|nr:abscisic acid 8'-hydroxylase 4-like [Mercurialis annua]